MGASPEEMWIDTIVFFGGTSNSAGGNGNATAAMYGTGGQVGGPTQTISMPRDRGTRVFTYALNSSTNNGGGTSPWLHMASSQQLWCGVWCDSGLTIWQVQNSGTNWRRTGGSAIFNSFSGYSANPNSNGSVQFYVTYWAHLAISGVSAGPLPVGGVINVTGVSFTAGINSIALAGTNCPTYTVVDDTHLNVTIPSGASSGTLYIDSAAGTATSSGTVTVSQAYADSGSAWAGGVQVQADNGSAWVTGVTVWADDGSAWHQIG